MAERDAQREVREETGIDPSAFLRERREPLLSAAPGLSIYSFMGLTEPLAQVVLTGEHGEFAWLTPAEAEVRLPVPERRAALRNLCESFIAKPPMEK
jgi:8-oxo-dGTP pyrophosphatase MutT (NUDIX family)